MSYLYGTAEPTPIFGIFLECTYDLSGPAPLTCRTATIAALFLLVGNFDELVGYFSVAEWIFYGLAAAALLVFRYRDPDLPRPFKSAAIRVPSADHGRVWIFIPALFCLLAFGLVTALFIQVGAC